MKLLRKTVKETVYTVELTADDISLLSDVLSHVTPISPEMRNVHFCVSHDEVRAFFQAMNEMMVAE